MFFKTGVPKKKSQHSQENTCVGVPFLKSCRPPTQVFPYDSCEIFKNSFFQITHPVASSLSIKHASKTGILCV